MHPKKEEVLKQLDEVSRIHDAALRRSVDIAVHPESFGWRKSLLTAAVVVPVTCASAIATDLTEFFLRRTDDEAWDRGTTPPDVSTPAPDNPA